MPVVLGGFAVFIIGLLAMAMAAIAWQFLRGLANIVEAVNPLSFFVSLGEWLWNSVAVPFVEWLVSTFEDYFSEVSNWIIGHVSIIAGLSGAVSSLARVTAEQLDLIRHEVVPVAQNNAEVFAIGTRNEAIRHTDYEAKLGEHLAATITDPELRDLYLRLAATIGGPGIALAASSFAAVNRAEDFTESRVAHAQNALEAQITDAQRLAAKELHDTAASIGTAIANLPTSVGANEARVREIAAEQSRIGEEHALDALRALQGTLEAMIPKSEAGAINELRALAHTLQDSIDAAESSARAELRTAVERLEGKAATGGGVSPKELAETLVTLNAAIAAAGVGAHAELLKARTELEELIGGGAGALPGELTNVRRVLEDQLSREAAALRTELGALRGELDQALERVPGVTRGELEVAKEGFDARVREGERSAERTLEGALGNVYGDITGKAAATTGDLTGIEALLAGAIAIPLVKAAEAIAHLEKCAVTSCEGPNNFGELLKGALGVVDLGALGVFLSEAIHDPAGAERGYADAVQGTYTTAQSGVDALLHGELLEAVLSL